jgi:hypothetical protein
MVALMVDSPAFTQVSNGPSDRVSHQPGPLGTGDKNADELVDHAPTARGHRFVATGIAACALSTPAQCKELTVASLTGSRKYGTNRQYTRTLESAAECW